MKIIIIRHRKNGVEYSKKAAGQIDMPLNEEGIKQAITTRNELANIKIDLIISSPLSRALETAKIVNERRNIPLIIDERAIERNLGIYEGKSNEQEIFNEIRYYTKNILVENGEDTKTFTKRVFYFLDDIIKKYKGNKETILIVTHGFF